MSRKQVTKVAVEVSFTVPVGMPPSWSVEYVEEALTVYAGGLPKDTPRPAAVTIVLRKKETFYP